MVREEGSDVEELSKKNGRRMVHSIAVTSRGISKWISRWKFQSALFVRMTTTILSALRKNEEGSPPSAEIAREITPYSHSDCQWKKEEIKEVQPNKIRQNGIKEDKNIGSFVISSLV